MFVLQLNPVTSRAEAVRAVAAAPTREELEQLLVRCRVDPYTDGPYRKVFRQGSPLEWCNPPWSSGAASFDTPAILDVGTEDDWAERARQSYREQVNSLPLASEIA